jgi:hypothetical protein
MKSTGAIIENEAAYNSAIKRNILVNANKTWRANTERAGEIEDALTVGRTFNDYGDLTGYTDNFIGAMASAFDTYGKLTPNQSAAILKGIDARVARRAEWADKQEALDANREHLGTVGQKITLNLTVKKIIKIEGISFSYYHSGITYLYIMEDAEQNVVIYKGNGAAFCTVDEGSEYTFTATVKEHGVRNGVKQTIIQRPKFAA